MDDADLEGLERELPALARVRRFARTLEGLPWFSNLGEPMTPGARAAVEKAGGSVVMTETREEKAAPEGKNAKSAKKGKKA